MLEKIKSFKATALEYFKEIDNVANQPIPPIVTKWLARSAAVIIGSMLFVNAVKEVAGPPPNEDVLRALDSARHDSALVAAIKDGCAMRYSPTAKKIFVLLSDCKPQ